MPRLLNALLLVVLVLLSGVSLAADAVYQLDIGAAARRHETRTVNVDQIVDSTSDESLNPDELARRLEGARIVLVGEEHTNMDFHDVQLRLIRALHAAGRSVIIGLEMFPYEDQSVLNEWVDGVYTEHGFVAKSDWYYRWGYHWGYYREIFLLAQQHGLPMKGLNAPRPVITKFRKQGRDALTEEQAKHLPQSIDTDSADHLKLFKSYFDADDPIHAGMTETQWQGMFQAQCAWDAVMGFNALRALEGAPDNAVVVVLVGAGHVVYGQGIARQIANWSDVSVATVTPIPAANSHGEPIEQVQASYGDFLWGLPATQPPRYPVLGTATIDAEKGLTIIDLDSNSAAARAGIKVGDRIVGLDAVEIRNRRDMNLAMAEYRWGDLVEAQVQRGDDILTVPLALTRTSAGQ